MSANGGNTPRTRRAPAKVNLSLEVCGLRGDGFHELRTVMLALDICDEVGVALRDGGGGSTLAVSGPAASADIPLDDSNLALAGARAAARAAAPDSGSSAFAVDLVKNLPSGAGLGGGSSDCAVAFLAALELLGGEARSSAARAALADCGSDCAFFAEARNSPVALCEGRGEVVTPWAVAPPPRHLVIVTPDVHLSTASVYRALSVPLSEVGGQHTFPLHGLGASVGEARAYLYNQLEEAALVVSPRLGAWRRCLDELGLAHFCLAGSGASFFGLYDTEAQARSDLAELLQAAAARGLAVRFNAVTRPFAGS